ncbi:hypothetical protein ABW19_dt0209258 [Dactylella cylindrospora]|nr:hypothetical protein ABW19_dt0209258 [Dactylella cylindrospora]
MGMTAKQAIACEWSFLGLALFFVVFRLYIRFFYTRNATFVDGLVVLTWLFFASTVACDTIGASKGLFAGDLTYNSDLVAAFKEHSGDDSLDSLVDVLQILYASAFPYISELWGLKVCFLILYGNLIPSSMIWLRRGLCATWVFVAIGYIVSMLMMGLWCLPVKRNWDVVSPLEDRCFAYSSYPPYFTLTAFHIISDICIYVLPFPVLKTLTLNRSQHWGVISIFALGGVCITATIARTVAIGLTANIAQVGFWTSFEQMTGLVVVCVPALKALLSEHRSRDGSNIKADYGDGQGSRMSRLQRISVTGNRSEGRGGIQDDVEVRWIRMDSPVEEDFMRVSGMSTVGRPERRGREEQVDAITRVDGGDNTTDVRHDFDEHLENLRITRKVTLKRDPKEGQPGRGRKFSIVERV